ncbi:MAG TPA: hypothetical protein DEV93_16750, partial [Chloroflexi bacterium]|nr:hypothetical protein [Chloroflexota bacterium]
MSHQDEDAEPSLVLRATAFAAGISTRGEALTYGIRRGKVGTGPVLRLGRGRMHVAPRAKMRSCLWRCGPRLSWLEFRYGLKP